MINRVVLVGRLTKDPELKYTQNGIAVARFTLAVNRNFPNQQGQREADFVNCVAWRKQAENISQYLRKGSLTGIDGRIQTSNFDGKDGNRVFMTEVVADQVQFLEPKREDSNAGMQQQPNYQQQTQQQQPYQYANSPRHDVNSNYQNNTMNGQYPEPSDDDLPF